MSLSTRQPVRPEPAALVLVPTHSPRPASCCLPIRFACCLIAGEKKRGASFPLRPASVPGTRETSPPRLLRPRDTSIARDVQPDQSMGLGRPRDWQRSRRPPSSLQMLEPRPRVSLAITGRPPPRDLRASSPCAWLAAPAKTRVLAKAAAGMRAVGFGAERLVEECRPPRVAGAQKQGWGAPKTLALEILWSHDRTQIL